LLPGNVEGDRKEAFDEDQLQFDPSAQNIQADFGTRPMMNILVALTGDEGDRRALEAAILIGTSFPVSITGLHVRPDPMQIVGKAAAGQFGTTFGSVEFLHRLEVEGAKRAQKAHETFSRFFEMASSPLNRLSDHPLTMVWQEIEGNPVADTIKAARYSDLLILARASDPDGFATDNIGAVLVACGRPVLLLPDRPLKHIGSRIAIAWKEGVESARAVTAAMPFLAAARHTAVITVAETETDPDDAGPAAQLAEQLAKHGISISAVDIPLEGGSASQALLSYVAQSGADLLVMGAYSHTRFREFVFGGFTRQILTGCDIPVFMLH
jgi:nucleotide-binding universal stress UspA family protein